MGSLKEKLRLLSGSTKNALLGVYAVFGRIFTALRNKIFKQNGVVVGDSIVELPAEPSFFGRLFANKKIIVAIMALILVAGIGYSAYYFFLADYWARSYSGEKLEVFPILNKGKIVGTFQVGDKANLGDLQVTLRNTREDSYRTLEVDSSGKRIVRSYFGIQLEIFNTSSNANDRIFFGLTDENGNKYERNKEIEFYLNDTKDFGSAKEIYPRTIRDGYLLFPALDPTVKKLQLVVFSEARKEKIIFEIER